MVEPLVLVPGMLCDARLYHHQILKLSIDHPVQVSPITHAKTVEAMARDVLAGAPKTFALAGISMGGIVAMEVLRQAPERISRIALMDTSPLAETPTVAAAREVQIVAARAGRMEDVIADEMKPEYLAQGPQRGQVLAMYKAMAMDLGADVFVRQSRALQKRPDQQKTLRLAKTPAMVMCGEYDSLCPVRRHEFMAELMPHAELKVIPDAGHLPTLEQPAATTDALRIWLSAPLLLR